MKKMKVLLVANMYLIEKEDNGWEDLPTASRVSGVEMT